MADATGPSTVVLDRGAKVSESIANKIGSLSLAQTVPSIYKVYSQLRDVNEKAYEPEMVAIGPYHHGKENLKMMDEHKLWSFNALLERKPDVKLENYISAVAEMETAARKCYADPISHISSDEFIEMLVLDSCFIIELMLNEDFFQKGWIADTLLRDLLLIENQIPFSVLCKLFDLIYAPNQHDLLICHVQRFFQSLSPSAVRSNVVNNTSHDGKYGELFDLITSSRSKGVEHILDLLHMYWSDSSNNDIDYYHDDVIIEVLEEQFFIRSATELTYANVAFKGEESSTLFDINFRKGIMRMPPLIIEDRTECLLRNLIAHEQHFSNTRFRFFTDYARLLNCLIISHKDVEFLSQRGIIYNFLGDNEVVAKILRQLKVSVASGPRFFYAETYSSLNYHCFRRWNRMCSTYFKNPWAFPSSIAAFIAFLLTVVQTVCSILERL